MGGNQLLFRIGAVRTRTGNSSRRARTIGPSLRSGRALARSRRALQTFGESVGFISRITGAPLAGICLVVLRGDVAAAAFEINAAASNASHLWIEQHHDACGCMLPLSQSRSKSECRQDTRERKEYFIVYQEAR